MGSHIVNGKFQSDKYPTCPAGKVPLSVEDPMAQDLLHQYAQQRRSVDAEFADDLEFALREAGYFPGGPSPEKRLQTLFAERGGIIDAYYRTIQERETENARLKDQVRRLREALEIASLGDLAASEWNIIEALIKETAND